MNITFLQHDFDYGQPKAGHQANGDSARNCQFWKKLTKAERSVFDDLVDEANEQLKGHRPCERKSKISKTVAVTFNEGQGDGNGNNSASSKVFTPVTATVRTTRKVRRD
jgi:hypothetical protein